jgi:hypothetical protein
MASNTVRLKLQQMLSKSNTSNLDKDMQWISDLKDWICGECPSLQINIVKGKTIAWLLIMPSLDKMEELATPDIRILINMDKSYQLQILKQTAQESTLSSREVILPLLQTFESGSDYIICQGAEDRSKCSFWIKHEKVHSQLKKVSHLRMCKGCIKRDYKLTEYANKRAKVSTPQKRARAQPGSSCNLRYLSPRSTSVRLGRSRREKSYLKKLRKKLAKSEIELDDKQSDELANICDSIEKNHKQELDDIIKEANEEKANGGEILKEIWELDMENRRSFLKDQNKNINGSRGNKWSSITFRMSLAIYVRSPAAYRALKGFNILQLPCVNSLKSFTRANLSNPGEEGIHMSQRAMQYEALKEEKRKQGKPPPVNEGILIFDEVKVIQKTMWNSKSNTFVGLSMAPEDMADLHDVFEDLDPERRTHKTNYILQFLWRDLVAEFDVLGPYYTAETSLEHKFIIACTIDAMTKFQAHGFKTKIIVCDGASSNLKAIKTFLGHQGTFAPNAVISPKFLNPLTNEYTYFIVCPTHQLKNMIAALYSSRQHGTKNFTKNGINFGWTAIFKLYQDDLDRARRQLNVHVPGMKLAYVVRDPWSRLNVKPAKIMQQTACIAALQTKAREDNDLGIGMTAAYLQACGQIFEWGFLSRYCASHDNQTVLNIIEEGMAFFFDWLDDVQARYPGTNLTVLARNTF